MLEMRDCNYHWNNKHLTRPEEIWIVMLINPKNMNHFDEEQKPDLVKQSLGFAAWRIFAKKNGNFKRKWGSCCVFSGVGALEFLGNYTQLIWLPNFRLLGAKFSKRFCLFWLGVCLRLYLRGKHDLSGPKKKQPPKIASAAPPGKILQMKKSYSCSFHRSTRHCVDITSGCWTACRPFWFEADISDKIPNGSYFDEHLQVNSAKLASIGSI